MSSREFNIKLSETNNKYNQLAKLQNYFKTKLNLTPVIGAELEFYLSDNIDISVLANKINYPIKTEKGKNQYEIDFAPSSDLVAIAREITNARANIINIAKQLNGRADFNSKPFIDDYGSSMHIHLSFLNEWDVEYFAQILCHYTSQYLDYFLPTPSDYARLDPKFMAPTHICWGGNNRTVLIRIPDSKPKRLEHRLASSNADSDLVISAILNIIKKGIEDKNIKKYPKIYGNAYDPQYGLKKIIK